MPDLHPLEPTDPQRLGGYRVTGRIGEGGQGVVYAAVPDGGGDRVAVKLFHAQLTGDPGALDTFARELEAAKQVARFCTAQVLDSGAFGNRRFIVSEYIDGPPLSSVVRDGGPRSGSALDRLAIATATALVALHDAGVVHRDVKPHNVLIGADGPRVIDFGISRALSGAQTVVSRAVGTPAYMAPEQLQPGELGPAVDVFAWASTMVFAATGRPPFGNESIPVVMNRIAHEPPRLDGVEEPLRGLLAECLAKDPARRPTAQNVLDRLVRRSQQTSPGGVPAPGPAPEPAVEAAADVSTLPRDRRRNRRRAGVLAGAGAAVVAGAAVFGIVQMADGDTGGGGPHATPQGTAGTAAGQGGTAEAGHAAVPGSGSPSASASAGRSPAAGPSTAASRPATSGKPSGGPSASPSYQRVELGPGHFSAYCAKLGWEWEEYRTAPAPGAYCVAHKRAAQLMSKAQLDAGCRWRYDDPRARHYFKGQSNYCYTLKQVS
ncbi:serine/threonine-protein kinase [Actinomadura verrucosospora]|uniref:Serine/threonine protein kinase n=1 Tax=Actinomadura verrucosospora TaxID=46165 RepID=A0A7D3VYQ9_ACTVE|nr:serine/threonine-protein kinase [Actinomadura verrucosospora]QKG25558.1 serine/threonine protein kinase [Actinomadura verrucosospora]